MGRTKHIMPSIPMNETILPLLNQSRFQRISAVASLAHPNSSDIGGGNSSTPIKKNKIPKAEIKKLALNASEDLENFKAQFLESIESSRNAWNVLKLKISVSSLKKPLKAFKNYRNLYGMGEIADEDYNEVNENKTQNEINAPQSAEKFKAPAFIPLVGKSKNRRTKSTKNFMTPKNPIPFTPITTITPKVNMNKPLSVVRHAKIGEQAVSLSGSPIMVSSVPRDDVATVSVPLHDGRVVTILPSHEFQREQMPHLDEQTKEQLETLYKNLAVIFEDNEDSIDN